MAIKDFVLNYFAVKVNCSEKELLCNVSYFDENYIDSLGVFELISALEDEYNFEFDDDDFQNRDFVTINGLSQIIEKKINAL